MRITVVTPLFPPDVSRPAVYAKSLCRELGALGHAVTLIHYGYLPEAVSGVTMRSIPSRHTLPRRLFGCLTMIWRERQSDFFIVLNGPSVELPFLLLSQIIRKPFLYIENDTEAFVAAGWFTRSLRRNMTYLAASTITPEGAVLTKPILHPLRPESQAAVAAHAAAWQEHITRISNYVRD